MNKRGKKVKIRGQNEERGKGVKEEIKGFERGKEHLKQRETDIEVRTKLEPF